MQVDGVQINEKPIRLILDCPKTGRTIVTHMSEDQLDMFIASCEKEQRRGLQDLICETCVDEEPEEIFMTDAERYFNE